MANRRNPGLPPRNTWEPWSIPEMPGSRERIQAGSGPLPELVNFDGDITQIHDVGSHSFFFAELRTVRLGGQESHGLAYFNRAYHRLVSIYGETPAEDVMSPEEQEIFTQWQAAEAAAMTATLGPDRYMGEAQFEIDE